MTTASVVQQSFRARNDDGNEATATWEANLNTNWSEPIGSLFRARFVIAEVNARAANNYSYVIWASKNGGAYFQVSESSNDVRFALSDNVTDGEATTNQLGSGTFVAGTVVESTTVGNITLNASFTEMEYVLSLLPATMLVGDTIDLRVRNGTTVLNAYTSTPTITASAPLAQTYEHSRADTRNLGITPSSNEVGSQSVSENRSLGLITKGGMVVEETLYDIG